MVLYRHETTTQRAPFDVTGTHVSACARARRACVGGTIVPDMISGPVSDEARFRAPRMASARRQAHQHGGDREQNGSQRHLLSPAPTSSSSAARSPCRSADIPERSGRSSRAARSGRDTRCRRATDRANAIAGRGSTSARGCGSAAAAGFATKNRSRCARRRRRAVSAAPGEAANSKPPSAAMAANVTILRMRNALLSSGGVNRRSGCVNLAACATFATYDRLVRIATTRMTAATTAASPIRSPGGRSRRRRSSSSR